MPDALYLGQAKRMILRPIAKIRNSNSKNNNQFAS